LNNPAIMGSSGYMPADSGQAGTTFGVRNTGTGQWNFYTQIWKRVSSTYQLVSAPVQFA
jgi:hypothetical protein